MPRIRSGLYLDNLGSTVQHTVNLEQVSCESIKSTIKPIDPTKSFNALQWFTAFNKSIGFNTVSNQISDNIYIYKSEFPDSSPLIQNNSIYKCCTILNGQIQECQQFLANIYSSPTTTTTKTTITTTTTTTTTTATATTTKTTTNIETKVT